MNLPGVAPSRTRPRTYKTRKKTAVDGILHRTTRSRARRTVLNKTFVVMMTGLFSFVSSEANTPLPGGGNADSNTIRIGNTDIIATYIRGISGQTVVGGAAVFVDSSGKLGTMTASTRFSDQIKPMNKASEAILTLKPVTFRYKQEIDPKRIQQFGLIAEEVEKVDPDLVGRDDKGKVYSVRYDAVNAMLLNEFLKEHRTVKEQG